MRNIENEIKNIYGDQRSSRTKNVFRYFLYLIYFVVSFCLIFVLINFGTFKKRVDYWFNNNIANDNSNQKPIIESINDNIDESSSSSDIINVPNVPYNSIIIESIGVKAPIVWDVLNNEKETEKNLKDGVIHLKDTAKPGEKGNVFITGHSSDYIWSTGRYKEIFVLLDKLVVGDRVFINYDNIIYGYRVKDKKIVNPNDTSVLEQSKNYQLTLMTCTPIGTALNRLIIVAEQFYKQ